MVLDYNKMPEPAVRLTDEKLINQIYDAMIDFFTFCILEHESRQVFYEKDNIYSGTFNIRIFWINKEKGLGYGIAADWKAGKIQVYRFGTAENWQIFKNGFAAQMRGDNS